MNTRNILRVTKNVAVVAVATVTSLAIAEGGFFSASLLEEDAKLVGKLAKHLTNPEVLLVKDGLFKSKTITINPVTGLMKDYSGPKAAMNVKPMKLK